MTETSSPSKSMLPHIAIAVVLIVVLMAVFLWPSDDEPEPQTLVAPQPVVEQPQETEPEPVEQPEPEPVETMPEPQAVVIDADAEPTPMPEPVEIPEPEPVDVTDSAVKSALLDISGIEMVGRLLVNDDLLRRLAVTAENLRQENMAPNHRLLQPPMKEFRIYQQADKEWIDAASYKRYTPYVEALESMNSEDLLGLYAMYKPTLQEYYAEIGDPDDDFDQVLIEAINTLLDTPEVPVPVEVYTDSVMYKYRDERLENLPGPQKQLLRTGPDNMRRIKAKLRELQEALEANGSR
ncbi:DUF3014 domain-containing protein [Aestuariibacter salexigens]|uniref:DUF3014 domain-containing protein n=1 Tax=Aestuariibacter salexigens TaxID=226010 RepID=UPI000422C965|nr:DUF3014 domain-containing protein [Aestuariibacter salexigens]